jgi:hypothetical protein
MTRLLYAMSAAILAGLPLAACGDDDSSPTSPGPETIVLVASLMPASEVPPVTGAEAAGSGTVTITLRVTRDAANAVSSANADFQVALVNFPAGTSITGAHIHRGASGEVGEIVVNTGLAPGEAVLTNGAGAFAKTGVNVTAGIAQQILTNPGQFYFNAHSAQNADGVARGQLVRQ